MSTTPVKKDTRLVQLKLPTEIKTKLDKIFELDGTTTSQGLKMIATQIANHGYSPFTSMQPYEQYSEPVSEEIKALLREDQLKLMGKLPDDSTVYHDEQSLRQAFKDHLGE